MRDLCTCGWWWSSIGRAKVNLGGYDPRPDNFSRFFIATVVKLIDPLVTIDNEILSHHLSITILPQRRSVIFCCCPHIAALLSLHHGHYPSTQVDGERQARCRRPECVCTVTQEALRSRFVQPIRKLICHAHRPSHHSSMSGLCWCSLLFRHARWSHSGRRVSISVRARDRRTRNTNTSQCQDKNTAGPGYV